MSYEGDRRVTMYKVCIFDLDGTLTDTLESLAYSVNATLRELGLGQITDEQCKAFVGNGARHLIERSIEVAGDPELARIDEAMEVYGRIFKVNCTYHVKPYPGVEQMLQRLKERGIKLAVLSNKPHVQTQDVVKTFFDEKLFDWIQGQKEGVPRKPDPEAAIFIANKLGVSSEECVYIGDSDVDMQTGNAAGMKTIGVTWGFRSKEVLVEHGAHCTIDHADELIAIVGEGVK